MFTSTGRYGDRRRNKFKEQKQKQLSASSSKCFLLFCNLKKKNETKILKWYTFQFIYSITKIRLLLNLNCKQSNVRHDFDHAFRERGLHVLVTQNWWHQSQTQGGGGIVKHSQTQPQLRPEVLVWIQRNKEQQSRQT